jgi:hypothetical protein
MDNDPKLIYSYFDVALAGIDGGVLWSGGTRMIKEDGSICASVAEVVARMGARLPNLITMGSCPRTKRFLIEDESHLMLGENTFINPGTQYVATIQEGGEDEQALPWHGDVAAYIRFKINARDILNLRPYGIVYSGGGVTVTETKLMYEEGILIIVVEGSGRQADDKLSRANFSGPGIYHVGLSEPEALRDLLIKNELSR